MASSSFPLFFSIVLMFLLFEYQTIWACVFLFPTFSHPSATCVSFRYRVHRTLPMLAFDKDMEEKLRTYKKFMVVRHPFERILSAYRDKLEDWEPHDSVFPKMVKKKLQKYSVCVCVCVCVCISYLSFLRDNPNKKEGDNITFTEYIRFISQPGRGTPEQRNEHWLPMHEICHPCAIQYDFIGKYENLKEDSEYLLKWLGVTDLMDTFPAAARPFHASRYDPKYFGQLSHDEIMAFHAKYLPDFMLFNYGFV
ncbi:carbohydrate sulfotransferase 11-like [Scylla paramamosain]|uniref:carbohydrate sulfotransferase 11-like n=1 Tax=Scylla paramamosain TaxID=85552 RepID=UPI0030828B72